jgi:hypothetical protein
MEIKLILIYLVEMTLNVVEVLQGKAEVILSQERITAFCLIPHALHVMNVKAVVITWVFAENGHGLLC